MFEKSQRKIVVTIMFILTGLFLGTLMVIYGASYFEVSNTNFDMLKRHAEMYVLTEHTEKEPEELFPHGWMEPLPQNVEEGKPFREPTYQLSTFYTVAVDENSQVLATDIGDSNVYDETTIEEYALDIIRSGKTKGIKGSLVYLVVSKTSYTLVAFMDNTVIKESMTTLFRYTFVFGGIALILIFFLSKVLARKIVEPLEKSYLKQKQFISDASHELKTPISIVNANVDVLCHEIGENKWLNNIQYENQRMGKLVGQLLELAKTEDVKQQMELLDFSRLIAGSVLPFESIAFEHGLFINTQIEEGVWVYGNSVQLKQLVTILVDNGIQHSQGSEELVVKLSQNRNTAILSVINGGKPISQDKIEHLFERFYRIDEARNSQANHYGLGLSIAKAIVDNHKGSVEVLCNNDLIEFRVTMAKAKKNIDECEQENHL